MRSNAEMANRQGDVDLRLVTVSAPQLTLWLSLAWLKEGVLKGSILTYETIQNVSVNLKKELTISCEISVSK